MSTGPPKVQRRWLRFSLRAMFLFTAIIAAWLAVQVNKAQKQRAAVEAIEAEGGIVLYDWQNPSFMTIDRGTVIYGLKPSPRPIFWVLARNSAGLGERAVAVWIERRNISDGLLRRMQQLPYLEEVAVYNAFGSPLSDVKGALPHVQVLQ